MSKNDIDELQLNEATSKTINKKSEKVNINCEFFLKKIKDLEKFTTSHKNHKIIKESAIIPYNNNQSLNHSINQRHFLFNQLYRDVDFSYLKCDIVATRITLG